MKTIAIILICLFASTALAGDFGLIALMETNGNVTPLYFTPQTDNSKETKQVKTDSNLGKKNLNPFKKMNLLDWMISLGIAPAGL